MSRRAPRPERENPEPPSESPWLMRGTFLLIPLLFLGCWILTYRTLQPRGAVGSAAGGPQPTPTTSLALKLSAASAGPGHEGPPDSPTAAVALSSTAAPAAPPTSTPEPSPMPTATEAPTSSPTPAGTTYVVKSGDTLGAIARASNVSVEAIAAANHLKPPYLLQVGDRLIIPAH